MGMNTSIHNQVDLLARTIGELQSMNSTKRNTKQQFAARVMHRNALETMELVLELIIGVDPCGFRDLSHDIRGKLTPVVGYASLMSNKQLGMLSTQQQHALDAIRQLIELIGDELDYLGGEMLLLEMDGTAVASIAS